jgi:hypothetical protein
LRVKDRDPATRVLTISRTVIQVDPKFHPFGARFLDDLIFAMPPQDSPAARLRAVPDMAALGFTRPNAAGRQYRHGTMSGYNAGKCRCRFCKDAAAIYRAQRRSDGKDSPRRPRAVDTDGHIPRDWFRLKVWKPTPKRAGITFNVRARFASCTCFLASRWRRRSADG